MVGWLCCSDCLLACFGFQFQSVSVQNGSVTGHGSRADHVFHSLETQQALAFLFGWLSFFPNAFRTL